MCKMVINLSTIEYPLNRQAKIVGEFCKYTTGGSKSAIINHGLRTENINSCTGILINSGDKNNIMYHIAPELQPITVLKKNLEKQIDTIRETCNNIKAFIYGGFELNKSKPETVDSFNIYNTTADVFDNLGVPFAMVCGKKVDAPFDNMYAINSHVTIWNNMFKNFFRKEPAQTSSSEIAKMLEESYQFVETSPEHIFSLAGQSLTKK